MAAKPRKDRRPGHERLSEYLVAKELSVRAFALLVECSKSYIGMLKTGSAKPGLELAIQIERSTSGAVPCLSWYPDE